MITMLTVLVNGFFAWVCWQSADNFKPWSGLWLLMVGASALNVVAVLLNLGLVS